MYSTRAIVPPWHSSSNAPCHLLVMDRISCPPPRSLSRRPPLCAARPFLTGRAENQKITSLPEEPGAVCSRTRTWFTKKHTHTHVNTENDMKPPTTSTKFQHTKKKQKLRHESPHSASTYARRDGGARLATHTYTPNFQQDQQGFTSTRKKNNIFRRRTQQQQTKKHSFAGKNARKNTRQISAAVSDSWVDSLHTICASWLQQ